MSWYFLIYSVSEIEIAKYLKTCGTLFYHKGFRDRIAYVNHSPQKECLQFIALNTTWLTVPIHFRQPLPQCYILFALSPSHKTRWFAAEVPSKLCIYITQIQSTRIPINMLRHKWILHCMFFRCIAISSNVISSNCHFVQCYFVQCHFVRCHFVQCHLV